MTIAYIGLGSNLADPVQQIREAITAIHTINNSQVEQISSLYTSRPMGPKDQPDYVNAVLALKTALTSVELLDALQNIENKAGRVRKGNSQNERWGARILDLDIILFGNEIIKNSRLTVPHYGLKQREFVLIPLAQIAPDLILPDGEKVAELSKSIAQNGLQVYID